MRITTPHLKAELTCSTSDEYASAIKELKALLGFIEDGFAAVLFNLQKPQLVASEGKSIKKVAEYRDFEVKYEHGILELVSKNLKKDG